MKFLLTVIFKVLRFTSFFTLHHGLQAQEDFFASCVNHMVHLSRIQAVLQSCDHTWKQDILILIDASSIAKAGIFR